MFSRRGEIWLINLDPTVGAEIKKTRPAIIISNDAIGILPLRVIVPLTDWKDRYQRAEWMIKISPSSCNHITKLSAADTFQIRSVSTARFISKIGEVSQTDLERIAQGIDLVVGFPS